MKKRPKKRKPPERKTHRTTEMYNAEQFIALCGDDLRYVAAWHKWLVWDGKRWAEDEDNSALRMVQDCARRLAARAAVELEEASEFTLKHPTNTKAAAAYDAAKKYYQWCITSQNERVLLATLALAKSDAKIAVSHKQLDLDPMLFNCENGTIDLKTGKLKSQLRSNLITKLAPVAYKPDAKAPVWMKFVDQVMGGDKELVAYLQRICGYALTGLIREHALFFFYGEGNNGKSTFLTTIHNMFGEYGGRASRGLLFRARNEKHPTSMATLHGKRFVVAPEIGENDEIDEPVTKDLTGGDPINARRMREDEWVFNPTHKLFLAGNHKPKISGTDRGIWRRLRVIPWNVTIPADKVDVALSDTLKKPEVLAGVLAWCVQGCLAWQKKGLGEPPAVITATDDYRKEQDMLGQFFAERLFFAPAARMGRALLRETYVTWCQELGLHELGYRRFAQALQKLGVTDCNIHEDKKTLNGWAGVRLATQSDIAKRKLESGGSKTAPLKLVKK